MLIDSASPLLDGHGHSVVLVLSQATYALVSILFVSLIPMILILPRTRARLFLVTGPLTMSLLLHLLLLLLLRSLSLLLLDLLFNAYSSASPFIMMTIFKVCQSLHRSPEGLHR